MYCIAIVRWFLFKERRQGARRLMKSPKQYFAPDLLFAAAAQVVWKRVRRAEIGPAALAANLASVALPAELDYGGGTGEGAAMSRPATFRANRFRSSA